MDYCYSNRYNISQEMHSFTMSEFVYVHVNFRPSYFFNLGVAGLKRIT